MTDAKSWRNAKLPKWMQDSIEADIGAWQLTAALAWPTETRPEPLPFRWGEYDRLMGEPYPGTFWSAHATRIQKFDLERVKNLSGADQTYIGGETWKTWAFRTSEGGRWHTTIQRGPLFAMERDARLYILWRECENAAEHLLRLRKGL
jgi:hypothetical protein